MYAKLLLGLSGANTVRFIGISFDWVHKVFLPPVLQLHRFCTKMLPLVSHHFFMLLSLYLTFVFQLLPLPSLCFQLGLQLTVLHLHFMMVFQQHLHLTLHTFKLWHKFLDVLWLKTTQEWSYNNNLVGQSLQETGQESSLVHNSSSDTLLLLLPFSSVWIQSPGNCREKQNFRNFSGSLAVTRELFLQMSAHCVLISCPMRLKLKRTHVPPGKGEQAGGRVAKESRFSFRIRYQLNC